MRLKKEKLGPTTDLREGRKERVMAHKKPRKKRRRMPLPSSERERRGNSSKKEAGLAGLHICPQRRKGLLCEISSIFPSLLFLVLLNMLA